jgi:hypothetical protein
MDLKTQITDKLFDQCVALVGTHVNKSKIKNQIIDPLFTHFKNKLRVFYAIITILLCFLILSNIIIIVQFNDIKKCLKKINITS